MSFDWQKLTRWDKNVLAKKSDGDILEMTGTFFVQADLKQPKPNIKVSQIMTEAEDQLKNYIDKMNNNDKIIHGYVLIRVGLSKIIFKKL
jgi:hypothetical protein